MRILGLESEKVTGVWRIHNNNNNKLRNLNYSQNIIRLIESRKINRAEHVAGKDKRRNKYKVLVGKPERNRDHLEDVGLDGRRILK
jgi:hypothetical protein